MNRRLRESPFHARNFYFEEETSQKNKSSGAGPVVAIIIGVIAARALYVVVAGEDELGDADEYYKTVGTDRPADEDETGRRVREREGGRSREAAEVEAPDHRKWRKMTDEEMLAYYKKHYEGVSRGKLATIDRNFYMALRRRELLDDIGRSEFKTWWSEMSDEEMLDYYDTHYGDLTRTELAKLDRGFYMALRRRGLLKYVPE